MFNAPIRPREDARRSIPAPHFRVPIWGVIAGAVLWALVVVGILVIVNLLAI